MNLLRIKVKQLSGELSKYSGWCGTLLQVHGDNCLVIIAPPPNFNKEEQVEIFLHRGMLLEIK